MYVCLMKLHGDELRICVTGALAGWSGRREKRNTKKQCNNKYRINNYRSERKSSHVRFACRKVQSERDDTRQGITPGKEETEV